MFEESLLVPDSILHNADLGTLHETEVKRGSRAAKIALIEGTNPNWDDLYDLL